MKLTTAEYALCRQAAIAKLDQRAATYNTTREGIFSMESCRDLEDWLKWEVVVVAAELKSVNLSPFSAITVQ